MPIYKGTIKYKVFREEFYELGQECLDIQKSTKEIKHVTYEIRRKLMFGLIWSLIDPEKDRCTSVEQLNKRVEELTSENLTFGGRTVEVDTSECIDDM